MSTSYRLGFIAGLAAVLILAAVIGIIARRKLKSTDYDERQQMLRGKAFQHGFMVILLYGICYGVATIFLERHFMEDGAAVLIGSFLGFAVFAVECVWKDAFFAVKNSPGAYSLLACFVILSDGINSIRHIQDGSMMQNGLLTSACMYPACTLAFLAILIAILLKRLVIKEAED